MVTFVKRPSDMKTMGVEVFKNHPNSNTYEIYAMFGPGMGEALFEKATQRAHDKGHKDVIANVAPGAQDAYQKRGFKPNGPLCNDKTQSMKKPIAGKPLERRSKSCDVRPHFRGVVDGIPAMWENSPRQHCVFQVCDPESHRRLHFF